MKLTSKTLKEYRYSFGYKIEFVQDENQKGYVCVIFKNSPLFEKIVDLKVSQSYEVVGWMNKGDFKCHPFDVVIIYKI